MGVIDLHWYRGWKDFLYVCVYVGMCVCMCIHSTGRKFYPIGNKFGKQVAKSRVRLSSKMGYVGPIETPRGLHHKKYVFVTFKLQV